MKIVNWKDLEITDNKHKIDARKLFDSENARVLHIKLEPGEKLIKHVTPTDVFFYVLEGKGIVEIGDEKRVVERDDLIESPAKIPHCWYNESDEVLRFLVVKAIRPPSSSKSS